MRRASTISSGVLAGTLRQPEAEDEGSTSHIPEARRFIAGLFLAALQGLVGPALAQAQKPNIPFIMGDDFGFMQPSVYHRRLKEIVSAHISKGTKRCQPSVCLAVRQTQGL